VNQFTSISEASPHALSRLTLPDGVSVIPCPDDSVWRGLRANDVTASVGSALLGEHEWETPFSLFTSKTGNARDSEETPPIRRGRLMEPVAVKVIKEDHPDWTVLHNNGVDRVYFRDRKARVGATPDVVAFCPKRGKGNVQIKSVERSIFSRKWLKDGIAEPPLWIAVQSIIEAKLTGAQWAAVAPIVVGHGIEVPLIEIPLDNSDAIMGQLKAAVADFWARVERNDPPPADYVKDGDAIARLYANDDGSTIDLTGWNRGPELAAEDAVLAAEIKERQDKRKAIKAEIVEKIGHSSIAMMDGTVFATAKTVRKKAYEVKATEYRDIRIKWSPNLRPGANEI
jgi:predicted phage-related endonuclease